MNYVKDCFIQDKRYDDLKRLKDFELKSFEGQYEMHKFKDLPRPEGMDYVQMFEKYNLKKPLPDKWINNMKLCILFLMLSVSCDYEEQFKEEVKLEDNQFETLKKQSHFEDRF